MMGGVRLVQLTASHQKLCLKHATISSTTDLRKKS